MSPVTLVKIPAKASAMVSFSSTCWQSFLPATAEEENKGKKRATSVACV